MTSEFGPFIKQTAVSAGPVSALYYSDPRTTSGQIVGAFGYEGQESVLSAPARSPLPSPRTPRPFESTGDKTVWCYSEAPLQSVQRVHLCVDGGVCIGLRFEYKDFDITLGQYRLDKESEQCFDNPQWGSVTKEYDNQSGNNRVTMEFTSSKPSLDGWFRMAGVMTWWFRPGRSEIHIVDQTLAQQ